jgi:transcriptional regulator with XRE-family HTH domain
MEEVRQASFRASWFGGRLRTLREQAGLSTDDVIKALRKRFEGTGSRWKQVSRPTVRRLEYGFLEITSDDLTPFLDLYGIADRQSRTQLRQLAEDVRTPGWWDGMIYRQDFEDLVWAESVATEIAAYHLRWPGQVQAPQFAEKLIRHGERETPEAEVSNFLEVRHIRAEKFRATGAPKTRLLLDESVFRQRLRICSPDDYAAQFRHAKEVGELDHVEIRYLPSDTDCPTIADVSAAFSNVRLRGAWPMLTLVETPVGAVIAKEPDINLAVAAFETLWTEGARSADQTVDFIDKMLREVEK